MLNQQFWDRHFQQVFVPHLTLLVEVLELRLLPAFDGIKEEAQEKADSEWKRLGRLSGDPDVDPSLRADQALEAGLSHYAAISDVRQALLNLYAAAIYHAWEQQLLEFHRLEVLHHSEEHDNSLIKTEVLRKRLVAKGIDISLLPSWKKIDELRLLANVVKHADGPSADQLNALRPDLFESPSLAGIGFARCRSTPRVYAPLSGEDVYVTLDELKTYSLAATTFWQEFSGALALA